MQQVRSEMSSTQSILFFHSLQHEMGLDSYGLNGLDETGWVGNGALGSVRR